MFFHSSDAPAERAADPEVRRANLSRISRLFAPYRRRLGGVLLLIVVSAGLGVIPAFLLKRVLEAIGENDTRALSLNAAGMIAIAIVTGVLGVAQTLLSNQVGQRVMHDLRAAVFRHLQRLSLAFFTRTRTGEVQSRISNDIGGVQNVVTNTATSIASNVTIVVATMVGMLVLSWQLALFAFALIPLFVLLTRRVGNERRRIAKTTQETLADISSLVQESLSVSGILLGKTMGRGERARRPLRSRLAAARRPRGAPADGGPLGDGVDPDELRDHARRRLLVRRARARARLDMRSRSRRSSRSRRCRRGCSSPSARCSASASTCRRRSRSSTGSSSTSTSRSTSRRSRTRSRSGRPATSCSTTSGSATARTGRCRTCPSPSRRARRPRSSARPAPARRRSAISRRASTTSSRGSITIGGVDIRDLSFQALSDLVGVVSQETYLFHESVRENLRFAKPDATDEEIETAAEAARIHHVIAGAARGLRHGRRRARLPLLRRREAADRDRAHDPAQPADPRPRRGDELARHRDRAARPGGARPALRGADDDRDRAPALDRPRRRPDRRARPRPRRRVGSPRGPDPRRRPLHGARRARRRAREERDAR